jgi:hypothetical protein
MSDGLAILISYKGKVRHIVVRRTQRTNELRLFLSAET